MKQLTKRLFYVAAVLIAAAAPARPAAAQLPLLEKYTLESTGDRPGVAYELFDQSLGGGDAHSALKLSRGRTSAGLLLKVWRVVRPGQTSFALLGERIEVRAYDFEGTLVFSRDLVGLEKEGIHFGDSKSGRWFRKLTGIPLSVRRVEVTYLGNYE
jgi:hypothetical protein